MVDSLCGGRWMNMYKVMVYGIWRLAYGKWFGDLHLEYGIWYMEIFPLSLKVLLLCNAFMFVFNICLSISKMADDLCGGRWMNMYKVMGYGIWIMGTWIHLIFVIFQ